MTGYLECAFRSCIFLGKLEKRLKLDLLFTNHQQSGGGLGKGKGKAIPATDHGGP
jgi:hypothetical protein